MNKEAPPLRLHNKFTFWFQHFVKGEDDFEESLLPVATVTTPKDFWAYYQHFKRPSQLDDGSYIYFFQDGVKPVWEDPKNKNGGAFILKFVKEQTDRLWQDILLAYVSSEKQIHQELNGIRIKVRKDIAEIDFWLSEIEDPKVLEFYRQWIIDITSLDEHTPLEVIHFRTAE